MANELPTAMELNLNDILEEEDIDNIQSYISDYLTDKYGFCHFGFEADLIAQVKNIQWDIDDEEDEEETSLF